MLTPLHLTVRHNPFCDGVCSWC